MKTVATKQSDITRQWFVVDASDMVLGRLATEVATILKGKHKTAYSPYLDCGDHVIVVNASKVVLTSNKAERKYAYRHSGYPGSLRASLYKDLLEEKPEFVVEKAIKGMLPKGPLGRKMAKKLKVYGGSTHPHQAQNALPLEFSGARKSQDYVG
ncbi:50S ribosomal protein L13 [Ferrithrix thermotolerans]|nr:50S ribosomal protein L13 [Ferrithrix thermotolerans]